MSEQHVSVAIVGGGPSGLTAAAALAGRVDGEVLVLEREAETGGIPRHSDHLGYGIRDLKRFISGPAYARRLTDMARDAGAVLETGAMVTGWAGERRLQVTSPRGVRTVTADAVVLATGARERPRPARLVPGDRPDGVYTTGQLQNLVHLHHVSVGTRAVIVGAELVSWSAVMTLRETGCATVAMVSGYPRAEAYAAFRIPGRALLDGPVLTRSRVVGIHGKHRVRAVTVENLDTGTRTTIDCDTVVFTGDWIPDHELARTGGLTMDPATRGPVVDAALRTSTPGVFAAGNLLHPVDTADCAALDGRHVATAVRQWLTHFAQPSPTVRIRAAAPFRWVAPQLVSGDRVSAPRGNLVLWVDEYRRAPRLRAVQDGRIIGTARTPWPAAPGRVFRAPWSLLAAADPAGGDVTVQLA
ncbi:FAD-dependent pyridine nucleotide-disulfide oxidoreductase [Mycolicibacterium phlei]|jgi:thioredoxin reductase|uniref:FAD-dependent pyridine nucleotide-disulfide oxidoreductase n=1 Tax=Mycolicibacterium phlei DSM 43239 = CCUG 21000 TaxID=1226750 RepID=A0A5N5UPN5_MYCPH|nr:FAD-dependent oxidoreductase [Mycolicibacterium phlei]VEG10474.1 FAD-dependent pyridine nucleotide-disulfide oxidoreductase [Mycobacteroides chelonae]AMO62373.1 Benzene 1,2-dioxygenase system ferredoxin--NAD(+) reductase subunit [Mycolicibacterium phlei]KAB7751067.1 FAD-dependent pyridine nucleotide-disulfide oxidoreductase [Mycolicibacterium phlei DSM 43239 = CCUG 21000]KXW61699.1 FAD-dependent pyridine nucleotide-disulfide oxidoreductase [Mycolicibacterium phlei DSM 43239 = CCUG 21000]KXW